MTLEHFVITRFCLRDRWLHRGAALAPFRPMDPLAPRTVGLRLGLLETTCLPALRAQTNRDFTWILLIDRDLGQAARRRLRDMMRGFDRARIVEYRAESPPRLERLGWLRPFPSGAPDHVLTTLNDDDDALPRRWIEVVQSHVRGLAGQDRLPPFKLVGARRIVQWDMVFTPDAPFGWAGPWQGLASVASCGFSLLGRWPAFDFSVLGLSHVYAETYGDFPAPPPDEHVRLVRRWFLSAAREARMVERIPSGRDAFFDASREAGAVVMSNHGGNFQPWRLHRSPLGGTRGTFEAGGAGPAEMRIPVKPTTESGQADHRSERSGAATFPDVAVDPRAAHRHRRHFRPRRVRARLLEHRRHDDREAEARRLRGPASGVRSRRPPAGAGERRDGRDGVKPGRQVRLATATTEGFVPGTLVLIDSFLRRHPGFDGEIVVIHDGLPGEARTVLAAPSDAVRFVPVSPALRERAERLCAALAPLPMRPAQFWTFEAFRLAGAAKLLLCDSDLLFRASIEELFDSTEDLLCCGDLAFLDGYRVDADTFLPVERDAPPAPGRRLLGDTFNSGFLCIDGRLTGERVYADLLAAMSPAHWRGLEAPTGEQPLLNRYFAGRQTLVSSTYNFLIYGAAAIRAREGVELRSAKVVHFNSVAKPWRPDAMLRWTRDRWNPPAVPAFKLWHDAYVEALVNARVRIAARGREGWTVA